MDDFSRPMSVGGGARHSAPEPALRYISQTTIDRQRAQLKRIQDEAMSITSPSVQLMRARLNSIADIAAQMIRELGE